MKRMNKVIAFSALAALTLGANSIQAGAYGETTEKSTLTADTKGVADYQTWKENTWTGKQSIDSGKIALTPGATEKEHQRSKWERKQIFQTEKCIREL